MLVFLFIHGYIIGKAKDFVRGKLGGTDRDRKREQANGKRRTGQGSTGIPSGCTTIDFQGNCTSFGAPAVSCPSGLIARTDGSCVPPGPSTTPRDPGRNGRTNGTQCIWPARVDPATGECKVFLGDQPGPDTDWLAAKGSFDLPAIVPHIRNISRHVCPSDMVLGTDMLCYPKQVLSRSNKFRKWRPGARPVLTGGQRKGIQRARSSITTAKAAISGLGVTVKKNNHKC